MNGKKHAEVRSRIRNDVLDEREPERDAVPRQPVGASHGELNRAAAQFVQFAVYVSALRLDLPRNPELLRSWADGNVVLIGDAVQAMMPNLGQGGCQAIEDAYVLSETLAETDSTANLEGALQKFYRKRIVRVSIVQFLSKLASDLIINAFDTPWSPHDNLGQTWKSYLTFFWKVRISWPTFKSMG